MPWQYDHLLARGVPSVPFQVFHLDRTGDQCSQQGNHRLKPPKQRFRILPTWKIKQIHLLYSYTHKDLVPNREEKQHALCLNYTQFPQEHDGGSHHQELLNAHHNFVELRLELVSTRKSISEYLNNQLLEQFSSPICVPLAPCCHSASKLTTGVLLCKGERFYI